MATVLHLITGLDTGGAEGTLTRVVTRLDPRRHRSVVVSMTGPGALGAVLSDAGIEVFCLGMRRGLPDPRGLTRFAGILRQVQPDIVQTWLYHADLVGLVGRLATRARWRLFWNIRCTDMVGFAVLRRMLALSSAIPELVVVNSLAGLRFHQELGYTPRRWVYIPNGCDTAAFRFDNEGRRMLRAQWAISDQKIVIGLPARCDPMKDHDNFLDAAALLAARNCEVNFVLVGPGIDPLNRSLVDAIARRGLNDRVHLLGHRDDMVRVYSAFDIATLTSAYGEGSPNVLIEAMACGLPCAATDCGDAAELLGPNGRIVQRRDPEALVAAWSHLITIGRCGREALGQAARQRAVQLYDLSNLAVQYDAIYS
jgi:glycosyltransferase involved in cell wall biosynthesis